MGREKELADLNERYLDDHFQLFVLYGRRHVRKTTLLNEFCKDKTAIGYSSEQSTNKLNQEKFSLLVFQHYDETALEPKGKNWYATADDSVITVNAYSFTIITAHKEKK